MHPTPRPTSTGAGWNWSWLGVNNVRVRHVGNDPKARRSSSVSVHAAAPPPCWWIEVGRVQKRSPGCVVARVGRHAGIKAGTRNTPRATSERP